MKRFGWIHFAQAIAITVIIIALLFVMKYYDIKTLRSFVSVMPFLNLAYELSVLKVLTVTDTRVTIKGSNIFKSPINIATTDIADVHLKSGRAVTEVIINMKDGSIINRDIRLTKKELSSLADTLNAYNVTVDTTPYKKVTTAMG